MRKVLFILLIFSIQSYAQIEIGSLTTSGQKITEGAIEESAFVIKQFYQVKNKKNGKIFGRNGRKDFGHSYSVGVKTEAGLVMTDMAIKPWLYDDAFQKVKKDYEPFVSLTETRDVRNSSEKPFGQCPLKIGGQQLDGVWIANTATVGPNEMGIDVDDGVKDGWFVWLIAKKDLETDESATIVLHTSNKKIEIKAESEDLDIDIPSGSDLVLGGFYVCPSFIGGGRVAYKLDGIAIKDENKWKLRTPFVGFQFNRSSESQEDAKKSQPNEQKHDIQDDEEDLGLTPIDEKAKKQKKSKK